MQLCSSSTTTTVKHSFTTEYVALTLKGHPVFACTQTTELRVLSDFFEAEGEFVRVRQRPVLPLGGGGGERDMVIEIDRWQCDGGLDSMKIWIRHLTPLEILQAPQPPFSFSVLATSF